MSPSPKPSPSPPPFLFSLLSLLYILFFPSLASFIIITPSPHPPYSPLPPFLFSFSCHIFPHHSASIAPHLSYSTLLQPPLPISSLYRPHFLCHISLYMSLTKPHTRYLQIQQLPLQSPHSNHLLFHLFISSAFETSDTHHSCGKEGRSEILFPKVKGNCI